jgi:hypothetical protein
MEFCNAVIDLGPGVRGFRICRLKPGHPGEHRPREYRVGDYVEVLFVPDSIEPGPRGWYPGMVIAVAPAGHPAAGLTVSLDDGRQVNVDDRSPGGEKLIRLRPIAQVAETKAPGTEIPRQPEDVSRTGGHLGYLIGLLADTPPDWHVHLRISENTPGVMTVGELLGSMRAGAQLPSVVPDVVAPLSDEVNDRAARAAMETFHVPKHPLYGFDTTTEAYRDLWRSIVRAVLAAVKPVASGHEPESDDGR